MASVVTIERLVKPFSVAHLKEQCFFSAPCLGEYSQRKKERAPCTSRVTLLARAYVSLLGSFGLSCLGTYRISEREHLLFCAVPSVACNFYCKSPEPANQTILMTKPAVG
jgi:hypothetical protein